MSQWQRDKIQGYDDQQDVQILFHFLSLPLLTLIAHSLDQTDTRTVFISVSLVLPHRTLIFKVTQNSVHEIISKY